MTTTLRKEKVAKTEPEVVSFPPQDPNQIRRILIASALVVLAGLVATVVYFATRSSQEAPTSPPAQAQASAPVENWSYPEMTPDVIENVPARPYLLPEMSPRATEELEVVLVENWSYPETRPESPTRPAPQQAQSGPR